MLIIIEKSQIVLNSLKTRGECTLEGMNMTEIIFLEDVIKQLNINRTLSHKELTLVARRIVKELLLLVGTKEDLMYFAEKLDMVELVLCGGSRE
jgi:hypothetical protein